MAYIPLLYQGIISWCIVANQTYPSAQVCHLKNKELCLQRDHDPRRPFPPITETTPPHEDYPRRH